MRNACKRPPNNNLIEECLPVCSLLQKVCHGNGAISPVVQLLVPASRSF